MSTLINNNLSDSKFKNKETVLIEEISTLMLEIIEENSKKQTNLSKTAKSFEGQKACSLPINKYIARLVKYSNTETSSIIIAIIYLDRICEMDKINLNIKNFHRLFLISFVIAVKYNEDKYYSNTMYAKMGGISLNELNHLESSFLESVEFFLFVENEIFDKYLRYLIN